MKSYSRNALYTLNSVSMFLLPKKRAYLTKVQRYNGYAYLPMTRGQHFCNTRFRQSGHNMHEFDKIIIHKQKPSYITLLSVLTGFDLIHILNGCDR